MPRHEPDVAGRDQMHNEMPHEYFEELCALAPIGQLSASEYRQLSEHLTGCPACRHATDEFSVILEKLPVADAEVDERVLSSLQGTSYRERFLQRAVAEGVPLTRAVTGSKSSERKWPALSFRLVPVFAAAAAMLASVVVLLPRLKTSQTLPAPLVLQPAPTARVTSPAADGRSAADVRDLEAKIAALENEAAKSQAEVAELKTKLGESNAESDSAKTELGRAREQLVEAQQQASDTQRQLVATRADLDRARSDKDSLAASVVDAQARINNLSAEVKEKDAVAERERQLTAVAKDVRELMGARNLHILDVSDVDGRGRSNKSFGRVFLVEGKSLIFYAFDLGDHGNPAKVSFQAWAQQEGKETAARNLGVFYVDDHAQKRWVLKVNDPVKLTAINSVFVTVEPLGGADRPTGRKLLYAFLGTQANHP